MVEWDEHPAVSRAAGLLVHELDDEEGLLEARALPSYLGKLGAVHPVALGSGVLDLDTVLVPYSAVSFQVTDRPGAGLAPAPEGLHHVVLLGDGGALLPFGCDLLGLGVCLGDEDPGVFLALPHGLVDVDHCHPLWGSDGGVDFVLWFDGEG